MFFSTRSNLHFPGPTPSAERIVVAPKHRVPDECLKDPAVKAGLLAKGLIEEIDPKPAAPAKPQKPALDPAAWAFEPSALVDDSLDVLNMKIQGHASKIKVAPVKPFSKREEALEFMTKDWKPES